MYVGFYLVSGNPLYYQLASILLASIRRTMPSAITVQLTDLDSHQLPGVDMVRRLPKAPLPLLRSQHFASVTGDWVFVDTDVVFQSDVSGVFNIRPSFDIAVADRNWPHLPNNALVLDGMPYNAGVLFSRSPSFWREVHQWLLDRPHEQAQWYGDQRAICEVSLYPHYRVHVLSGAVYNYPPLNTSDPALSAAIVHCKGPRKEWMTRRVWG